MPLTALEAMALGTPLIAASVGGLPEVVVDGRTGRLFPAGDASALSDRLQWAFADPARLRRLGEEGRRRYWETFSSARLAKAYNDVLARVENETSQPRPAPAPPSS
jgi:glycosyltransferase involved in cell wall biosynthesis